MKLSDRLESAQETVENGRLSLRKMLSERGNQIYIVEKYRKTRSYVNQIKTGKRNLSLPELINWVKTLENKED